MFQRPTRPGSRIAPRFPGRDDNLGVTFRVGPIRECGDDPFDTDASGHQRGRIDLPFRDQPQRVGPARAPGFSLGGVKTMADEVFRAYHALGDDSPGKPKTVIA